MKHRGVKWAVTIPVLFVLLGLTLCLRSVDLASPPPFLPRCGFHYLTGLHCPGCGNTRATYALLHGDVGGALRQNGLFVIGLPFLIFWACRSWISWIFPHRVQPLPFRWRQPHTLAIVWLVVGFGVVRNIPLQPFSRLAPIPITVNRASPAPALLPREIRPQEVR